MIQAICAADFVTILHTFV